MTARRRTRFSLALATLFGILAAASADAQGVEAPRVPIRTARQEINTLRAEYADLYNNKNATALTAMYLPDAFVIQPDGTTLHGRDAIGKALAQQAPSWKKMEVTSDTLRVFGNTAWDVGTLSSPDESGEPTTSHYLVVLRRGVQTWKISSLAVVPEAHTTSTH